MQVFGSELDIVLEVEIVVLSPVLNSLFISPTNHQLIVECLKVHFSVSYPIPHSLQSILEKPGASGRGQFLEPETNRVLSPTFSLFALRKHAPLWPSWTGFIQVQNWHRWWAAQDCWQS